MRLNSWSKSPPNGVKALGVRALGTFSAIAVLLGETVSDVGPADDNAITVELDAATFMQSSPRPRAELRPRRAPPPTTDRADSRARSRSADSRRATRHGPRPIPT